MEKIKSLSMFFGVQIFFFVSSKPKVVLYGYTVKHTIDFGLIRAGVGLTYVVKADNRS